MIQVLVLFYVLVALASRAWHGPAPPRVHDDFPTLRRWWPERWRIARWVAGVVVGVWLAERVALPPASGAWLAEYALDVAILTVFVVMVRRRLTRNATVATVAGTHGGTQ